MTTIIDAGDLRKYRTEIPNMVDDMGLSVYAFRLYAHLKRAAGDSGVCFQGRRKLAEHCGMSAGMITKAKRELVERGLIEIAPGDSKTSTSDTITIIDIWRQNFGTFSKSNPGHDMTTPSHTVTTPGHVIADPGHVIADPGHVVDHKKEPFKKEPFKKEPIEEGEGAQAPGPLPITHEFVLGLCVVCHGHKAPEQLTEAMRAALSVEAGRMAASGFEVADLRVWWATYQREDWRWKKGKQRPKPHDVRVSITKAVSGYVLEAEPDPAPPVADAPPMPAAADVMPKRAAPSGHPMPLPDPTDIWATALYDLHQMQNLAGDVGILDGSRLEHVGRERDCEIYQVVLARPDFAGYASRRLIPQLRRALGVALQGTKVVVTIEKDEAAMQEFA